MQRIAARSGTPEGKEYAAAALANLALGSEERSAAVAAADGIEPLVAALRDGTRKGKDRAARTLYWLISFGGVIYIYIYICTYTYTYAYTYAYTHTCACTYTDMYVYVHIYNMHIHIHMHVHIHIHIHEQ